MSSDQCRSAYGCQNNDTPNKMSSDLSPRKTMLVLVIVVGCFAVLWPKVFYPMLVGSANQHIKPSPIDKATDVKQERPLHLRSEMVHPAFRERGRAIPQPSPSPSRPPPRIVEGRPGPIPGMRPAMGGAGHVVPPSQKGTSSMSVIMPIYTIGIVIFFTYTLMKLMFKKQPEGIGGSLYPPVEPDRMFRRDVFESEKCQKARTLSRDGVSSKLGDAELDQLRRRLQETELAMERIVAQMSKVPLRSQNETIANGNISNGNAVKVQEAEQEQTSVKVLGMEMTASCEGGQKWSRPNTPIIPVPATPIKPSEPPQAIYLEGALPAQSQILVADSAIETQPNTQKSAADPPVVLAGKMTLSVISLDTPQENEMNKSDKLEDGRNGAKSENEDEEIEEEEVEYEEEEVEVTDEEVNDDEKDDERAVAEEMVEESKYTTASCTTAAENEISEDKNGENDEETEEEIEIEEDEEIEEIEIEVTDEEEEEVEEEQPKIVNHVNETE